MYTGALYTSWDRRTSDVHFVFTSVCSFFCSFLIEIVFSSKVQETGKNPLRISRGSITASGKKMS